jgi:hypothetical protein
LHLLRVACSYEEVTDLKQLAQGVLDFWLSGKADAFDTKGMGLKVGPDQTGAR